MTTTDPTDYRTLFADKDLVALAEEISQGINDLEPDQSWTDVDTAMLAFAKMHDAGYRKPFVPDGVFTHTERFGFLAWGATCSCGWIARFTYTRRGASNLIDQHINEHMWPGSPWNYYRSNFRHAGTEYKHLDLDALDGRAQPVDEEPDDR
jgi:hypothetical protein